MSRSVKPTYLRSGTKPLRKRPNRFRRSGNSFSGASSPLMRRGLLALGGIAFLGALMAALFFLYRWGTTTSMFALEEIEVQGNERLSYGDVLLAGRVRLGQNSWALNLSRVEALLSKNPWVENVSVRRELPRRMVIAVEEKTPEYWIRRGGSLYYADARGELIAAVSPSEFTSLPVLEADMSVRERLAELPEMVKDLNRGGLTLSRDTLAWVRLSGAGQAQIFLDDANLTLTFALEDWRSELRRVRAVTQDVRRRGELDDVRRITASGGKVWVERTP
ncbi:MAG: FtsQ-type POTRA domain-containing protein [Desulfovibrio sp.]|nr:FtsQ-type POTRA domain-containing protein [Desulfovibrio sp.]